MIRMYSCVVFYVSSWKLLEVSKVATLIPILQMRKLRLRGLPCQRAALTEGFHLASDGASTQGLLTLNLGSFHYPTPPCNDLN